MQNREDIFNLLRNALVELFELDPASISLESHLYQIWKSIASMPST